MMDNYGNLNETLGNTINKVESLNNTLKNTATHVANLDSDIGKYLLQDQKLS